MRRRRRSLAAAAYFLALGAWALAPGARAAQPLVIGELFAIPRPPGFIVEDARPQDMKAADRRVNVSPVDLLAEALITDKGDSLAGKKLVVTEFSFTTAGSRNLVGLANPVVSSPAPALGALAVASGMLMLKGIYKDGAQLDVKIVASLDGRTFEGSASGDIPPKDDRGMAETIVHRAIRSFIYNLSRPEGSGAREAVLQTPPPQEAPAASSKD